MNDPHARLAYRMLRIALNDAVMAYARSTVSRAAEARFWLLFGGGADLAELLGVDAVIERYVLALPPLPGQDSRLPVIEWATLAEYREEE